MPTLAYVVQGGTDFSDKSTIVYWIIMIGQFLFGIILIALLAQILKKDYSLKNGLLLLVTGPAVSLGIAYLLGSEWQLTFFNYYLIEGFCLMIFLLLSFFQNREKGIKEQGKANVYVAAPILIGLMSLGLLSTINTGFLLSTYEGWLGILAIVGGIAVSFVGFKKNITELNSNALSGKDDFSGINGVPMFIGMILWFGRNSFLKMDFFQEVFMLAP